MSSTDTTDTLDTVTGAVSEDVLSQWREQGYLLLKQAIPRDQAAAFLAAADEVIAAYEAEPGGAQSGSYTIVQAIWRTAGLDDLIDHPGTFPTIMGLMGPYLQLMGTQIYVRPAGREADFRWHTDAGRSLQQIRVTEDSLPLNFKVQFFLTDIPALDRANFCLVPGSHRHEFPEAGFAAGTDPDGAIQLRVQAGDAAIFPHNLWHSVAPNHGDSVRRSVTFRYGQMWCRPYDYEKAPAAVLARMPKRRRRLLGDLGDDYIATDYYKPHDQLEVMLGAG